MLSFCPCLPLPALVCRTAFNEYQLCVEKRGKTDVTCLQRGRDYVTICPQKAVSHLLAASTPRVCWLGGGGGGQAQRAAVLASRRAANNARSLCARPLLVIHFADFHPLCARPSLPLLRLLLP